MGGGRARRRAKETASATAPPFASGWLVRHAPLLAASVAFVVFLPSLASDFLYDDAHVIVENRAIRDLSQWRTVLRYEPSRPLLSLTWALNYALFGLRPWPYHLVNVVLHAANAALLASLLLFLAGRGKRVPTVAEACLAPLLFAASPMAVETVAYVSSRSTALATAFALATLRLALPAVLASAPARLLPALGFYVLALATKEEAASVPLFLLLLDRFFADEPAAPGERRRRLLAHAPFWVLPAAGLVARRVLTGEWLPGHPSIGRGTYLWTQWTAFPLYLLRSLLPVDPAFYRGHPLAWPLTTGAVALGAATAAIVVSAVALRRRWPEWTLAVAWLAAALVPSSTFVPLSEMVVDHRAYLGGAFALVLLARFLLQPRSAVLVVASLLLLAGLSVRYERVLGDPVRAWEDAVARAPRAPEAQRGLAEAYARRGDPRAEATLEAAVRLDPRDAQSWTNLGVRYAETGRYAESIEAFSAAARAAPQDARIHDNLGLLLRGVGRVDEARRAFETAARLDPGLASARINLAEILLEQGDATSARRLVDEAARLEIDAEDAKRIEAVRARTKDTAVGGPR